jgi:hypothetical protein
VTCGPDVFFLEVGTQKLSKVSVDYSAEVCGGNGTRQSQQSEPGSCCNKISAEVIRGARSTSRASIAPCHLLGARYKINSSPCSSRCMRSRLARSDMLLFDLRGSGDVVEADGIFPKSAWAVLF